MAQTFRNNYVNVDLKDAYATVELIGTGFRAIYNKTGNQGLVSGTSTAVKFTTVTGVETTGAWPETSYFGDSDTITVTGPASSGNINKFTFTSSDTSYKPVIVTVNSNN